MSKSFISRLFVGSLLAMAGGFALLIIAGVGGYLNGAFAMEGPDVVGVQSTNLGWTVAVLGATGILAMMGGAIGQFVAWIGAVVNTAQLQDKTWFLILLLLGLLSFGFVAMLVYVMAGPDDTARVASSRQQPVAVTSASVARGA